MERKQVIEWIATKIEEIAEEAKISIKRLSEESGIPYTTLVRKVRAKNKTSFNWAELLMIADTLNVDPSRFTPPIFMPQEIMTEDKKAKSLTAV